LQDPSACYLNKHFIGKFEGGQLNVEDVVMMMDGLIFNAKAS